MGRIDRNFIIPFGKNIILFTDFNLFMSGHYGDMWRESLSVELPLPYVQGKGLGMGERRSRNLCRYG